MERTAVFTITESNGLYEIKCKAYPNFNQYYVPKNSLFPMMCTLTDIFNNRLNVGILFEVA